MTTISSWTRAGLTAFVIFVGGTGALQAVINTRCSKHLGDVFLMGTAVSFYGGWVLLCFLVLIDALVSNQSPTQLNAAKSSTGVPEKAAVHVETGRALVHNAEAAQGSNEASPAAIDLPIYGPKEVESPSGNSSVSKPDGNKFRRMARCDCLRWRQRPSWYHFLPGVFGATFVTASLSITVVIGYALYFVMTTAGFLVTSAIIDHRGAFGGAVRHMSWQRLFAILVAMAGAVMAVYDRLKTLSAAGTDPGLLALCIILSFFAGFLLPNQASINRQAAERLPSKLAASWWSFTCGCVTIAIALAAQLGIQSDRAALVPHAFTTSLWWHYMGGPLGVIYIASGIYLVRIIGSAPFFVALTCGQLATSAAIDATGALGAAVAPVTVVRGIGIALVMVAAGLMQAPDLRWGRRRTPWCRSRREAPELAARPP